ncbi:hypothetical protein QFZ31_000331 [Neobacillus niacini]|nr:hypothetical protein [Neobacillus niacini]
MVFIRVVVIVSTHKCRYLFLYFIWKSLRKDVEAVSALENINSFVFYDSPTDEDRVNSRFNVEGYVTRDWLEKNVAVKNADVPG